MKPSLLALLISTLFIMPEAITAQSKQADALAALPSFDDKDYPPCQGGEPGLTYSAKKSVFKIWSPRAKSVTLHFYEKGFGDDDPVFSQAMKKKKNGLWSAKLKGDHEGKFYAFQVETADTLLPPSPGPDARAVGVNGQRGMVVDLKKTNPDGWEDDQRPALKSFADIILYEIHVRDASIHPNSGIVHRGKFLGLAETGTKTADGQSTGIDHIKEMGVTHVHLLPSFDFRSVDESPGAPVQYNWGYDPQNYNVPEGSYATDAADGRVRIREFKQLVKTMHDNGLRVVMDVVYNHTGYTEESVFNRTVPGYYYRQNKRGGWSNASACGNEVASERPMVRRYIVESMKYWAKEYHIDGFRVDLMGIHDIETMNEVARELHKIDPTIFIYGEGWKAGDSPLPDEQLALKKNMRQMPGISAFSDDFRDGVKGHVFTHNAKGFASGGGGLEESVKFGVAGAIEHPQIKYTEVNYSDAPWANQPTQCINYVSCHDNHTLYDRIEISTPELSEKERLQINKLAQTLTFTSQGVPFLHAGEEFVRTKNGVENSFASPDEINQINWDNKTKYNDLLSYYKALIQLRKKHPAFRMGDADLIRKNIKFMDFGPRNLIGYELNGAAVGDTWKRIMVIYNGNTSGKRINVPEGDWEMVLNNYRINENGMGKIYNGNANLLPFSAMILVEK